jgi:hypothetical protein
MGAASDLLWRGFRRLVSAAATALIVPAAAAAPPASFELFVAPDRTFALYRPAGWDIQTLEHADGRTVTVAAPRGHALVRMTLLKTDDRSNDSVQLAARTLKNATARTPSLRVAWARSTSDRRRTVVEVESRRPDGTAVRGRQYFLMNFPEARVYGYEAESGRFASMQPELVSVLANFTVLDPSQFRAPAARAAGATDVPLQSRRLQDGSASLQLPADWQMIGAKGAVLTKSRDGNSGFAFANAGFWGPSNIPYFDSSRLPGVIHAPYMPPVDAMVTLMTRYGSRDFRVLQRASDPARAAAVSTGINRRSDVETALLTFTNEKGVRCKGYYEVIGTTPLPSGQWGIVYFAVWAPDADFDRELPTLVRISSSFRIDERWAADYLARGIENLKRQMAKTSQMMADTARSARESSLAAFRERARSSDYIDYKRTSTIRGEQEWVSQVEGGALYKSDRWGLSREGERVAEGQPFNYYNYEGRNPRYNEQMTPVDASREVFERVYGARP